MKILLSGEHGARNTETSSMNSAALFVFGFILKLLWPKNKFFIT